MIQRDELDPTGAAYDGVDFLVLVDHSEMLALLSTRQLVEVADDGACSGQLGLPSAHSLAPAPEESAAR